MAKMSESLKVVDSKYRNCSFCGCENTEVGGYWCGRSTDNEEQFRNIIVCEDCKDNLIHLYIDTCVDVEEKGKYINGLSTYLIGLGTECGEEYSCNSIEEMVSDYLKVFVLDNIVKKKELISKQNRYREYLKLKAEFENFKGVK